MNSLPLVLSAGAMGLAGSLHCVAMCGALQRVVLGGIPLGSMPAGSASLRGIPIVAAGPARPQQPMKRWARFQAGRLAGYSLLGLAAGFLGEQLLAAARAQPVFESVWAVLNASVLAIGLLMVTTGRVPGWLASVGSSRIMTRIGQLGQRLGPALRGAAWSALPCGLLYAAIGLAMLAAEPVGAALTMFAFGLGTMTGLGVFEFVASGQLRLPGFLRRGLPSRVFAQPLDDRLVFRLNGLVLALAAGAGLAAALTGTAHPFC